MLSKLRSYWDYGNTFCGIELTVLNGKEMIFCTIAKEKKGEFTDLEFLEFTSISDIGQKHPKPQHCYVAINSEKVFVKFVSNQEKDLKTVSEAFPGLALADFYYEIFKTTHGSIVSICRKDYILNLLKNLKQEKFHVLGFHLGINPLQPLTALLQEESIITPRYIVETSEMDIKNVVDNEDQTGFTYQIDTIKVESKYLLSLSMLFNYTGTVLNLLSNITEENSLLLKAYKETNFFKKALFLLVGIMLISLLINTFIFNSTFKKEQLLNEELIIMLQHQKGTEEKLESVVRKEHLVNQILNSGSSKTSYYLNSIVALKSSSIGFSDIQYQPLQKTIRPDKPIEYSQYSIIVSGESKNKLEFTKWISDLENLKWIERVSVVHYGNLSKGISSFSVTINVNNDSKN